MVGLAPDMVREATGRVAMAWANGPAWIKVIVAPCLAGRRAPTEGLTSVRPVSACKTYCPGTFTSGMLRGRVSSEVQSRRR